MRPESALLGPLTWQIVFRQLEAPDWGECDPTTRTISINDPMELGAQKSTLVHECIHAMWVTFGWPEKGKIVEEEIIRFMEIPLYMFIRDNPHIVEWLQTGSE